MITKDAFLGLLFLGLGCQLQLSPHLQRKQPQIMHIDHQRCFFGATFFGTWLSASAISTSPKKVAPNNAY